MPALEYLHSVYGELSVFANPLLSALLVWCSNIPTRRPFFNIGETVCGIFKKKQQLFREMLKYQKAFFLILHPFK